MARSEARALRRAGVVGKDMNQMGSRAQGIAQLRTKSDAELSDARHGFIVAVMAYSTALTTCKPQ